MTSLSPETWVLVGVVAGVAVVAILYVLAATAREEIKVHDLKRRIHELHAQHTLRLAAMRQRVRALEELEATHRSGGPAASAAVEGEFDLVEEGTRAAA